MPTRSALALLLSSVSVALALASCGDDAGPPDACESRADCAATMECVDGRCVDGLDAAAPDAGPRDAAPVDAPATDAGPIVGAGCSADLRTVLGFDGAPLARCGPDEGCFDGACVAACDAAARSRGSLACRFAVPTPGMWEPIAAPCFAVFLASSWPRPVRVTLSRGGETYDVTRFGRVPVEGREPADWTPVPADGVPAGGVAVLFLSSDPEARGTRGADLSCPITPAVDAATELREPGIGDGWLLELDAPVAAYDILPFGGAQSFVPSAELLLPTSIWDDEYVVLAPPTGTHSAPGPLWIRILAMADGTEVTVQPSVDLPAGGGLPAIAAGATGTVTLDAWQYAHWPTGAQDPSGTLVRASEPVGVFAGSRFLRLQPAEHPGGESEHQQVLPLTSLSHEYVAAPFETRRSDLAEEVLGYRVAGAFDGTTLGYDPPVPGAPTRLDQGDVASFTATGPFRISSQDDLHPFAFAQLMRSAYHFQDVGVPSREGATYVPPDFDQALGDEEMTVLFPPAQFLPGYVFFTDPTYGTTSLALTRVRGDDGFADVEIGCLGVVDGFRPVGADGRFEVATVDLRRAGVGVGACSPGHQTARSDQPFGLVVWGIDSYASYAYPAGGNATSLRELPPLF